MRKPIVAVVYAVSCTLAVCGGFVVAQSTHSATPEHAAQLVSGEEEDLFGPEDDAPALQQRTTRPQARPQPGLNSTETRDKAAPEDGDARPQGENPDSSSAGPEVAPASAGQPGSTGGSAGAPARIPSAPSQRIPAMPEQKHVPPPAPAAEPLEIPQIPFPTLTINELPVNPPKPEPLRPLQIG